MIMEYCIIILYHGVGKSLGFMWAEGQVPSHEAVGQVKSDRRITMVCKVLPIPISLELLENWLT